MFKIGRAIRRRIVGQMYKSVGKKKMQKIYEGLFHLSLSGMIYGNGGDFKESGELAVLTSIKNHFKNEEKITVFDVGGNVGNYARSIAEVFGNNTTIYSFEPSKKTFDQFLGTTAGISNIIPNNLGLSDSENKLTLYTNKDHSGLSSLYNRELDHLGIDMSDTEEIDLSTIDTYCAQKNIDRIHFLKLDIEGHELSALKGAAKMIHQKKIDFIQFEFGGCNIDSKTYFKDFFNLLKDNYRIYRILKDGLQEIPSYHETCEIFITINYLAQCIN
jgi:FkbM family methyltransferase